MFKSLNRRIQVIGTFAELGVRVKRKQPSKDIGTWLSNRFQVLGPTYIKIGQFISSRSDIFGEEFTEQFVSLRDQVSPIPPIEVQVVLQDLKARHAFLKDIDEVPLAAASIGQVHKATDVKGNEILVKVKRPSIKQLIFDDIEFLKQLLDLASLAPVENVDNTRTMLKELEYFLLQEVSFTKESENLAKFYSTYMPIFGKNLIVVPRMIRSGCTDELVMMEYIHDKGYQNYKGDRLELAKDLMRFFVRQLVQYGILHGDPHKGNIGITHDDKIVLYDYGNIIYVNEAERNILKELIYMLIIGNKYGVIKQLDKLGVSVTDKEAVFKYIDKYVEYMKTLDIKVFKDLDVSSNSKLPIHLSGKIIRILRVYGILEGFCKELDPSFNYFMLLDEKIMDLVFDSNFLEYKVKKDLALLGNIQNVVYKLLDE